MRSFKMERNCRQNGWKNANSRYNTCYKHTLSFLQWKYKVTDIDIARLDYEFISEYEFWLKSVRKCDHNTAMQYLRNFKKIINRCLRNGWLPKNPFIGFKMTNREVERIALTEAELQTIMNQDFPTVNARATAGVTIPACWVSLLIFSSVDYGSVIIPFQF